MQVSINTQYSFLDMVFIDSCFTKFRLKKANPYFFGEEMLNIWKNGVKKILVFQIMFLPPFCPKNCATGNFASEQLIPGIVARGEGEEHSPLPVPNHEELGQGHVLGHLGS
jgi:hypothetical protein